MTIGLVGATAGCMGQSEEDDASFEPTETVGSPVRNETERPPLTNATPRQSSPRPTTARTDTPPTRTTTQATPTPNPTPSDEPTDTATPTQTERTTTRPTPTQTATPTPTPTPSHSRRHPYLSVGSGTGKFGLDLGRYPVMGFDRAPVEVLYWSDYLCDYCSTFATSIQPRLIKTEVKRGNARFVFLELPNIGQNSRPAAMLSKAVWKTVAETDPGLFWEWHQAVFERQKKPDSGWADFESLLGIAKKVGIDAGAVRTTHDTHRDAFASDIEASIDAADRASIPGTPAFHVYNRNKDESKTIIGAQPLSMYRSAIQSVG